MRLEVLPPRRGHVIVLETRGRAGAILLIEANYVREDGTFPEEDIQEVHVDIVREITGYTGPITPERVRNVSKRTGA